MSKTLVVRATAKHSNLGTGVLPTGPKRSRKPVCHRRPWKYEKLVSNKWRFYTGHFSIVPFFSGSCGPIDAHRLHPFILEEATVRREICYRNGILDQPLTKHYRFYSPNSQEDCAFSSCPKEENRKALNFLATEILIKNCLWCTLEEGQSDCATDISLRQ